MIENTIKKVSVIIPVYNVEQYIDQCLLSVTTQTFNNLEIIIIYDKSVDNTFSKCQKWAEKDHRVLLINNSRRNGLGAARNYGLRMATGAYVVYLDSDDWIKNNYIEILYDAIEKSQANYVSSVGYYGVKSETQIIKKTLLPSGNYCDENERAIVLLKDAPAVWKKIYNREWLLKNNLLQPEIFHYEDWGFDISLVSQATKIALIPESGVFYRIERDGCLSNDNMLALYLDFKRSIEFGLECLQKTDAFNRYRIIVQKYLLHNFYMREKMALEEKNEEALKILDEIKTEILIKRLGYQEIDIYKRYLCFGSFSLRWIMQRTTVFARNLEYYGFSSIISAITSGKTVEIKNGNAFRRDQVSKDILGSFKNAIETIDAKTILFIDFMEERNHVLALENGQYITQSEAYIDSFINKISIENKILSGTDKFTYLWREKCKELVDYLKIKGDLLEIVLIRNRMSLRYGDLNETKEFVRKEEIVHINDMISNLENYFLEQCRKNMVSIKVFDLPEAYCFTDTQFRYGCEPQYMNEALYTYLGFEIFRQYEKEQLN